MTAIEANPTRFGWMAIPVDSPVFQTNDSKLKDLYLFLKRRSRRFIKKMIWGKDALTLEPGDFIFGRNAVAQELGVNPSTVRDKLYKLRDLGLVERLFAKGGSKGFSVWRFIDVLPPKEASPTQDIHVMQSEGTATNPPKGLKRKRNHHGANTAWITPDQVVVNHPIIKKADKTGALERFKAHSEDFLQWLVNKATKIARDPANPVPLVLHWLSTGKQNAAYADVMKNHEKLKQIRKRIESAAIAKKRREQKQEQQSMTFIKNIQTKCQQDPQVADQVQRIIETRPKAMDRFLIVYLGRNFKPSDVIANFETLAMFEDGLRRLLAIPSKRGSVAPRGL